MTCQVCQSFLLQKFVLAIYIITFVLDISSLSDDEFEGDVSIVLIELSE